MAPVSPQGKGKGGCWDTRGSVRPPARTPLLLPGPQEVVNTFAWAWAVSLSLLSPFSAPGWFLAVTLGLRVRTRDAVRGFIATAQQRAQSLENVALGKGGPQYPPLTPREPTAGYVRSSNLG